MDTDHQQYLRFMLDREGYQSTCLPFGLSCAPNTFAKVMKPLMTSYQFRSLNAFRSAISSVHERVDGIEAGKHPMITRLLKGAFHARPPLPCYKATWDVQMVLEDIKSLGTTNSLLLKQLSHKLCIVLALIRPLGQWSWPPYR